MRPTWGDLRAAYVWLTARRPPPVEPLAAPVLHGARYAGRPVYYSDVIVRHDSPITRLEELEGRSWAYNEPASHSGHTVTLYTLVRLVDGGSVDTAAIDSQVLAIELREPTAGPRAAGDRRLRTLDHPAGGGRQPSTRLAQAAGPGASGRVGRRPGGAVDAGLRFIRRFSPADDAAYDDIRAMLATIEAAGWTSLTQMTVARWHPSVSGEAAEAP